MTLTLPQIYANQHTVIPSSADKKVSNLQCTKLIIITTEFVIGPKYTELYSLIT